MNKMNHIDGSCSNALPKFIYNFEKINAYFKNNVDFRIKAA